MTKTTKFQNSMIHFLITRFNLRSSHWQSTKDGNPILTEDWLEKRFQLFETYCLPSVKNQSQQNFIWLVLFDVNTPALYRNKARRISQIYSNFKPIFIDGMDSLKMSLNLEIKRNISRNDEYIITSRLDNDDLIHRDYIKTIQFLFKPIDQAVIDLRRGYQVTLGNPHPQIRQIHNAFNPYISLIENTTNFKTVFERDHKQWRNSESVIKYQEKRLWCEIVHGQNVLNSTSDNALRNYSLNSKDFAHKEKKIRDSRLSVFLANAKLIIKRAFLRLKIA